MAAMLSNISEAGHSEVPAWEALTYPGRLMHAVVWHVKHVARNGN